jgi:membrane associated rhomboid family serine protease
MAIIPLGTATAGRRSFAFMTYALVLANIGVFVYEVVHGPQFADCFTNAFVLVPSDILHDTLHSPLVTGCSLQEPTPVYLTLLTAMFLHANLLHLGGNMLYLWAFGGNLEARLGHIRYLLFYFVCGLLASGAQIAFSVYAHQTDVPTLGASGAIAGVLGAYLVFFPGSKVRTIIFFGVIILVRLAAFIVIGFFIILQVVEAVLAVEAVQHGQGQGSGVAFFAHLGGFVMGLLLGLVIKVVGPRQPSLSASVPYRPAPRISN